MRYRSGLPCPALRQAALRQPDVRQQDIAVIQNDQYETVRYTLKNELTPWYRVQRGYPPVQAAALVVPMEERLDLYGSRTMCAIP